MDGNEHHCKIPSIVWIPLITCVVLLFILDVFQIKTYTIPTPRFRSEDFHEDPKLLKGFLIRNEGCRIPYLDPFDKLVKNFIEKEHKPNCSDGKPSLYEANDTSLFLLTSSLPLYNVENVSGLSCCYTEFRRKVPTDTHSDNKVQYSKECIRLEESAIVTKEFVRVTCKYGNETVYEDYFAFVPLKNNTTDEGTSSPKDNDRLRLNVLVFGLDAVSRVNFHRQMPQTAQYLKDISAVELLGYNKVGDNTFPNLVPVLTGFSETELRNNCWHNNGHFDKCRYIWDAYKEEGYLTSFGEDSEWMGIFNYAKRGFQLQPTDYMWGAFNREAERAIGNKHKLNIYQCVGSRQVYKTLLDHINKFTTTMFNARQKYFAFYWLASLGHDYLNMPNIGDETYKEFFTNLKESGKLENTVLFFMSDHGIRWGGIRETYQGRLEERLPFLFVILPDWFKNQYPTSYRSLLRNVRRLTSPYDLHETFVDLLDLQEIALERYANDEKKRGYSLFTEISPKRTCEDGGISSHWCACQQSYEIERNSSVVQRASKFVVDHMNFLLKGYTQCSNLTLNVIKDARLMTHGEHMKNGDANFKDYTLTIQTEPGDGIFESTVRHHIEKNNSHFEIMGTISRLNLYGKQSSCVMDFHLKLYCYCSSLLSGFGF